MTINKYKNGDIEYVVTETHKHGFINHRFFNRIEALKFENTLTKNKKAKK